jgi:hypothetical protein
LRIFIRTSKWAIWARRYASLTVPLIVIPVLLHRERLIGSDTFRMLAVVAFVFACMALALAIAALVRLWIGGNQGWDRAIFALVISLTCLAPFAWHGLRALQYPQVTDVATAPRQTLPLVFDEATAAMRPPVMLPPSAVGAVFPNAKTRSYPLNAQQAFEVVRRMVGARGWEVNASRPPEGPRGEGLINARVTTLLGWRDEVVIKVTGAPEGASIDMRSVSLNAVHDFGGNGLRVEEFLSALDEQVTALLRDNPNITEPIIETPSGAATAPAVPAPRDPPERAE